MVNGWARVPSPGGGARVLGSGSGGNLSSEAGGYVNVTGAAERLAEAMVEVEAHSFRRNAAQESVEFDQEFR